MQAESDGLNKRIAHSERAILRRKVARQTSNPINKNLSELMMKKRIPRKITMPSAFVHSCCFRSNSANHQPGSDSGDYSGQV
jgi:hypothetical protein